MELQYLELIEKHNLKISELPTDAIESIKDIEAVIRAVNMREKSGKQVSQKVFDKLARLDKWTYLEILDYVNDTNKNDDEAPVEGKEIIADIKKEEKAEQKTDSNTQMDEKKKDEPKKVDQNAQDIENELTALSKLGKSEFTLDELKSSAKKCYNMIFETYTDGGENGIETSRFSLIENQNKNFNFNSK